MKKSQRRTIVVIDALPPILVNLFQSLQSLPVPSIRVMHGDGPCGSHRQTMPKAERSPSVPDKKLKTKIPPVATHPKGTRTGGIAAKRG